jgi:hypothetical protein
MGYKEKNTHDIELVEQHSSHTDSPTLDNNAAAIQGESFIIGDSLYARIQRAAAKFNIELRGIERVPEDERTDSNLRTVGTMVCMNRRSCIDWRG